MRQHTRTPLLRSFSSSSSVARSISAALLFLLASSFAIADDQVIGLGASYWAYRQSITTATACVVRAVGSAQCALFPAGDSADNGSRVVVVSADGAGYCCFAGAGALVIDSNLRVTDPSGPYGTGQGACYAFPSTGGEWQVQPNRSVMVASTTGGARIGLCSAYLSGANGSNEPSSSGGVYAPCSVDADCTNWTSAGTCTTSPSSFQQLQAGVVLNCAAASGTINVAVRKEYVRRGLF
jgi:hypothetical protein